MIHDLFGSENLDDDIENEEDSSLPSTNILDGVVVTDSDWTAETILSQLSKGNIALNPKFQRRDAWTDERKSKFIESLLLGVPIPQLVLAEIPKTKGKFVVIDGKQRLLSLHRFAALDAKPLKLKGLEVRADLNGLTWDNLKAGAGRSDDVSAFENAPIRTTFIRGFKDERALFLIFHRLNSGSVALSPQELRHVLHPGPFIDFAFEFTEQSVPFIRILGKDGSPDFRMRDVEMLIRFFGFEFFLDSYQGDLKQFLDITVKELNTDWPRVEGEVKRLALESEYAIEATLQIFKDDAFSKYGPRGFERRFNRAVFDIMIYFFSDKQIRDKALDPQFDVKNLFSDLCNEDSFRRSLETTTKSHEALITRLRTWGLALTTELDIDSEKLNRVLNILPRR